MGLKALGVFSVLMAALPLLTFRLVRQGHFDSTLLSIFNGREDIIENNRLVMGGIAAVVMVNVVLFSFVLNAFFFEKAPSEGTNDKKSN